MPITPQIAARFARKVPRFSTSSMSRRDSLTPVVGDANIETPEFKALLVNDLADLPGMLTTTPEIQPREKCGARRGTKRHNRANWLRCTAECVYWLAGIDYLGCHRYKQ